MKRPSLKDAVSSALRGRARWVSVLFAAMLVLALMRASGAAVRESTIEASLAGHLAKAGLEVDPRQVVWLANSPNAFGVRPALFLGQRAGELHDVYYGAVRVSERAVLEVYLLTNITRTTSADEDQLVASGPFVAYTSRVGETYDALVVLDTRGEPESVTRGWPRHAKWQNAITNLQDSGRPRAFGVRRYAFVEPPHELSLSREHEGQGQGDEKLVAQLGEAVVTLDPSRATPLSGAELISVEDKQKGQPGLITWVVDTVRRVPWIGRGPIEWLEHTVFKLQDRANRVYHGVVATDTAAEAKEALAAKVPSSSAEEAREETVNEEIAEADIGWPPPALVPVLPDRVEGEGEWFPIAGDPFVAEVPGAPPLFYQTFIRVDPERTFTRVYLTMWDPRQVQLGMVMGTKEPESATGETGSGMIPRDPFVLRHVVGAFNGGFQALHGEFGAMADRRVYLPPKPFAATVAVYEDGRVGMGSWPGPGRRAWDEELANSQIPNDMVGLRQNLTSVVEDGVYNPWKRWWWGAAPEWAEEQTFIHRSGLCLTREGLLVYLWGGSMGPEQLGQAMLAARCVRGIHLDMNDKHTGFELYRPVPPGQELPPLGRALLATEYEGAPIDSQGFRFRVKLAVNTMTPVRFPRYIGRDPRDYFYLVRKPLLPSSPLAAPGEDEIAFETSGLPQTSFPYAFARARLPGQATVVRVDLTRAVPKPLAGPSPGEPLAYLAPLQDRGGDQAANEALYARFLHGRIRVLLGKPTAQSIVLASGPRIEQDSEATSALGVDGEGFLVYVEARTAGDLRRALAAAGVEGAVAVPEGALLLAQSRGPTTITQSAVDVDAPATDTYLHLVAEERPAAEVLFPEVEPMPYRKWGYLQDQRVRYFPSGPARFVTPEEVR